MTLIMIAKTKQIKRKKRKDKKKKIVITVWMADVKSTQGCPEILCTHSQKTLRRQ